MVTKKVFPIPQFEIYLPASIKYDEVVKKINIYSVDSRTAKKDTIISKSICS